MCIVAIAADEFGGFTSGGGSVELNCSTSRTSLIAQVEWTISAGSLLEVLTIAYGGQCRSDHLPAR